VLQEQAAMEAAQMQGAVSGVQVVSCWGLPSIKPEVARQSYDTANAKGYLLAQDTNSSKEAQDTNQAPSATQGANKIVEGAIEVAVAAGQAASEGAKATAAAAGGVSA
jgi:hypothetical protein